MTNILTLVTLILWMILAVRFWILIRHWNKKFDELYNELLEDIVDKKDEEKD